MSHFDVEFPQNISQESGLLQQMSRISLEIFQQILKHHKTKTKYTKRSLQRTNTILQASHSNFFNNTGIQYKISWKNSTIQDKKLPKYSKKLKNTGQKSRKYHLCMKNENIQYINASY